MSERDSGFEEIDFLLPNGLLVPLRCNRRDSLADVKAQLWQTAMDLPGFSLLQQSDRYVFIGVTPDAVEEEVNESIRIEDIRLAKPILEVSDVKPAEKKLREHYRRIGDVIGVPIQTLEQSKDVELQNFRSSVRVMCHQLVKQREDWSDEKKALFAYPPKLDKNEDLTICTARKIMKHKDNKIPLNVWINEVSGAQCYRVEVPAPHPPNCVVEEALACRDRRLGYSLEEIKEHRPLSRALYVLKVRGKEEYMLQESCIHTYEYIRTCINRDEVAELELASKDSLMKSIPDNTSWILNHEPVRYGMPSPAGKPVLTWELSHDQMYTIRVRSLPVNTAFQSSMYVQAQLFHGDQALCDPISTAESGFNVPWKFTVPIESLPRCARLCFTTCEKATSTVKGVNWVNVQVFDFTRRLVTGRQIVRVNNFPNDCTKTENRFGTPGSNTDLNAMELEFEVVPPCSQEIYYPSTKHINEILTRESNNRTLPQAPLNSFELLDRIVHKDPLQKMSQYEKDFLWENRYLAMDYQPNILPRVVQCVRWTQRHDVFELYQLLSQWPCRDLSLQSVLQLLGPEYPDHRVRSVAVSVLDNQLKDQTLELILLQLVQAVKLESYQHNDLSRFLLHRSLFDRNIGHRYFWHLRSEMYNGIARLRFALLLEAYCLYCGSAVLDDLYNEVQSIKAYRNVCAEISKLDTLEEQQNKLRSWMNEGDTRNILGNQRSILDQSVQLGELCIEECRVMSSKQRPLWLTWQNGADEGEGKVKYIIKDGDDLRQDMLVLQLIRLMDMTLKYCCRDYWLTMYECVSLDENFGIIEVVEDSKTVCDISMHQQTGVMSVTSMNEWLYTTTQGGERYMDAVKKFTRSCAGFCVITYILGIGDRHSDNIMLKKSGQLFHIDFGHFMNHKKSKFGVRRERTPFVMTKDFIRIVMKGDLGGKVTEKQDFQDFVYDCLEAYMTIRRHGPLFLTLLSLMMHCELPELQDAVDIDYCRKCLALDKPEHEAAETFFKAIIASYKGQWKTKIDWFLHRVNRTWRGNLSTS